MTDYSKTYLKLLERADQNRITDASGNVFELDPENETIKYISGPDIDKSSGDVIDTKKTKTRPRYVSMGINPSRNRCVQR